MASVLKKAILNLATSLGYQLTPHWRLATHPQATYLNQLLRWLDIDCVFDVGANTGQYRDFLRRNVEYDGTIVSFEPIPEHVELLRERARTDKKWHIEGYALGSTNGEAAFNVMAGSQFSSFLEPDHSSTKEFSTMNVVQRQVTVQVRALESVLPELQRRLGFSALYLKLDTQGYDMEVAKGAGAAMRAVRGLQTEASVTPLYTGAPDYCAAIGTFRSLGFELSGLFPNNPHHFPRLHEFDCHMIARDFCPPAYSGPEMRTSRA